MARLRRRWRRGLRKYRRLPTRSTGGVWAAWSIRLATTGKSENRGSNGQMSGHPFTDGMGTEGGPPLKFPATRTNWLSGIEFWELPREAAQVSMAAMAPARWCNCQGQAQAGMARKGG